MSENERTAAKVFAFGVAVKKFSHLTKAYACLFAAGIYGVRAAREANAKANIAFDELTEERQRPVIIVDHAPEWINPS